MPHASAPTHRLRPTRWSVVLDKDRIEEQTAEFRWAESEDGADEDGYVPPLPWLAGHPDWTDPHAFDRRAIALFYGAADADLVRDWARLATDGNFDIRTLGDCRAAVIAELTGAGDPVFPDRFGYYTEGMLRANQASGKAAGYLHQRGFDLHVLVQVAEEVRDLLAATDVEATAAPGPLDPDRPDDDLDRLLYALAAGMGREEILGGLTGDDWPDLEVLEILAALRS